MNNIIGIVNNTSIKIDPDLVKQAVNTTLLKQDIFDNVVINVAFVNDQKMAFLHRKYLGLRGTTDVISFPVNELKRSQTDINENKRIKTDKDITIKDENGYIVIGDLFISPSQAKRQAAEYQIKFDQEICNLVEHGVLHLLGIHHEES